MDNLIVWFRDILLAFENFFHQVHAWLMGESEDENERWPARVLTPMLAEQETEGE
jgi:hypothetical protein